MRMWDLWDNLDGSVERGCSYMRPSRVTLQPIDFVCLIVFGLIVFGSRKKGTAAGYKLPSG